MPPGAAEIGCVGGLSLGSASETGDYARGKALDLALRETGGFPPAKIADVIDYQSPAIRQNQKVRAQPDRCIFGR
jgi:hypothetical protein